MPTAAAPRRVAISTSPARSPTAPSPPPALDGKTVTIARDLDGNGIVDQTEPHATNADGSKTVTVSDLNADGSLRDSTSHHQRRTG